MTVRRPATRARCPGVVANMDLVARPGQTARLRFVLGTPGMSTVTTGGATMGAGGEMAGRLVVEAP